MIKNKKKKITVRFSKKLKKEMHEHIVMEGYGLHEKSRWLTEAIDRFLIQANYIDLVENGMNINQSQLSEIEAFYLTEQTRVNLRAALFDVRVKAPLMEGVQSAIIRASVVYRMMLNAKFSPREKIS